MDTLTIDTTRFAPRAVTRLGLPSAAIARMAASAQVDGNRGRDEAAALVARGPG